MRRRLNKNRVFSSKINIRRNSFKKEISIKPNKTSFVGIFLIFLSLFITIIGLVFIFNASLYRATNFFHDKFYFVKQQLIWLSISIIATFALSKINYKFYHEKILGIFLIVTITTLALVLILGSNITQKIFGNRLGFFVIGENARIGGATRWIMFAIGNRKMVIQPAEFAKLGTIIYLSGWLAKQKENVKNVRDSVKSHIINNMLGFLFIIGLIASLIILEPDMGTTMTIGCTAFILYFLSGKDKMHTIGSIAIVFIGLILVLFAGIIAPYRFERIKTFINVFETGHVPEEEVHESGHQIQQVLIGIGSGGLFGKGLGNSRQQGGYLVENTAFTDSIIAIILEEMGWVGGLFIIFLYGLLLATAIAISNKCETRSGKLLALGIGFWYVVQATIHICANISLIPLTGVTLPFISYGGSGLLSNFIGIGLLLSVEKYG